MAEKYFINKIYQDIIGQYPELKDKTVSLATDEMVFLEDPNTYHLSFGSKNTLQN
ncbi:MAG: hypothetical protein IKH88_14900 [Prevotella sp.]|nr:hypothetical protein [Prevotella sp.]